MAYFEIKAIKAAAAVHRGIVNLAARSLVQRDKRSEKKFLRQLAYADDLRTLARNTEYKASVVDEIARFKRTGDTLQINAATVTVENLKDDLTNIA